MALTERGNNNRKLGRYGERRACRYLRKNGYKILERNYKNPFGEVDIIARKGEVIAFTEVKARLSDAYGAPSEAVGRERQRRYIRAAQYYCSDCVTDVVIRFDIIEVYKGCINHIENAFTA